MPARAPISDFGLRIVTRPAALSAKLSRIPNRPVSIDTYKSEIAEKSLDLGVGMINDITALRGDRSLVKIVA